MTFKTFLFSINALVVGCIIFSVFQHKYYAQTLSPRVESGVSVLFKEYEVSNPSYLIEGWDLKISGTLASEAMCERFKGSVRELTGSGLFSIRAKEFDLNVFGAVHVERTGEQITVSGNVQSLDRVKALFGDLSDEALSYQGLKISDLYVDAKVFDHEEAREFIQHYFEIPGDRSLHLSAGDDVITARGTMTDKLAYDLSSRAEESRLKVVSDFEIISPALATLEVKKTGDLLSGKGVLPMGYDMPFLNVRDQRHFQRQYFVEEPDFWNATAFREWYASYFGVLGDRSFRSKGKSVILHGLSTQVLELRWLTLLSQLGVQASSFCHIYPSVCHFPDYQRQSKVSAKNFGHLHNVFTLNVIRFAEGSSDVPLAEHGKVEALAEAILKEGQHVHYVIGGYMKNVQEIEAAIELSHERAEAVVASLSGFGVPVEQFSIEAFGAPQVAALRSPDKRGCVEILVK